MEIFKNNTLVLQLLVYAGILLFFWILELIFSNQKFSKKLFHTLVNGKFLFLVVPVQIILSLVVFLAASWTETSQWGLMHLTSLSTNSFLFYILSFIALDFLDYMYHFMMHKTPLFWRFHQVHHSDMDVDITTTIREHPGETFIRVSYSILAVMLVGASPGVLIFKQFVQSFSNLAAHSNVKLPKKINKIVSLVFVTPNTHHVHHHFQLPYTDSNYGDVLTIWDRLFSTFTTLENSEIVHGVDTNMNQKLNLNFKDLIYRPFTDNTEKISSPKLSTLKKVFNNILPILLLVLPFMSVEAQTTVKGKILDENKEPIAYVDIIFPGTTEGTISDENGFFTLESTSTHDAITMSYLGFATKTIPLSKSTNTDLEIVLTEEATALNEIVLVGQPIKRLRKKENPAYRIMEQIWENKKTNGLRLYKSYEYDKYSTLELGMDNMDSTFLRKALKDDYSHIAEKMTKNSDNGTFYVPLELIEKTDNVYGNTVLNVERIDIEGRRKIGLEQEGKIFDRISKTFRDVDVYQNNIEILGKTFISPISKEGFASYDYVLADSTIVDNNKLYNIYFFPRQNGDFAFKGNFTVANSSFAITKIDMATLNEMNMNFVRNFQISKSYTIENDSVYLPESNIYKGDFTFLTKDEEEKGLYVVQNEKFDGYTFNVERLPQFYNEQKNQETAEQYDQADDYWEAKQNFEAQSTYEIVDRVMDSKKIKLVTGAIYTLSDGYLNIGNNLQLGSIWATTAQNDIEGLRTRMGFRTYKTENDRIRFEGFGAYGFKDKKFKYGLETRILAVQNPRFTISAAYLNDNEQMGLTRFNETHLLPVADQGSKALFNRGDNFFLSRIKKGMFRYDLELIKNLNIGMVWSHNEIVSADPSKFSLDYLDSKTGLVQSKTTDFTIDYYINYSPGKEVTGFGVDQAVGIKLHPTFMLNYRRGTKGVFNSGFDYNRIQALYNQPIALGRFGVFDATFGVGKTFEAVPLSLMTSVSANQTYFLLPNTFALLDYYEFVADTYFESHFEHHFNGYLLNRVPLIKKLNLRSLLTFRTFYGTVSEQSKSINQSNIIYTTPAKPYIEYGFGIENIGFGNVRPFRVDFMWRNDFQNFNGSVNPKFGVRLGIKTKF
tara:strand:+ start:494 stop:3838 length:3345 start_codon:yes stop_codon:yes gene_type:complete